MAQVLIPWTNFAWRCMKRQYNETWLIGRHGYKAPPRCDMSNGVPWLRPHHCRPEGIQKTVDRFRPRSARLITSTSRTLRC
jgi:hypothetical protein